MASGSSNGVPCHIGGELPPPVGAADVLDDGVGMTEVVDGEIELRIARVAGLDGHPRKRPAQLFLVGVEQGHVGGSDRCVDPVLGAPSEVDDVHLAERGKCRREHLPTPCARLAAKGACRGRVGKLFHRRL
jgi:hypothetical protein